MKLKISIILSLFVIALIVLYYSLSKDTEISLHGINKETPVKDGNITYLNTTKDVKYTGTESCLPCHRSKLRYWKQSEMGRTMMIMSEDNIVENYPQKSPVYDEVNDYYYMMFKKDGKFFQREYRVNSKREIIHERIMQAEYAVGSGDNLRMYLNDENGMFYQLPLTWNAHKKNWDLSPGFREYKNLRFSRYAAKKCIFCHNSYMIEDATAPNRYKKPYTIGIGCERCHGPGELHIKAENEELSDFPENIKTIVNPKDLTLNRQLAICMQCHLEGKAWVLQDENGWFDFRPGQLLSENRSVYYPAVTSKEAIEVGDSPHRLRLSRCFNESKGQLTCLTCHDPHKSIHTFTRKHYNDTCIGCHKSNNLSAKNSEHFHKASDDCVSCHMNRTGSENTLHGVSLTDHWIRVDANKTKIDWTGVRHPEKRPIIQLVPEINKDDENNNIRKGIAYFEYRNEYDDRKEYLDSALTYLLSGLQLIPNSARGLLYLGKVYLSLNRTDDAVSALNNAINLDNNNYEAYYEIGKLYKNKNQLDEAGNAFRKALQLKPNDPSIMEQLGFILADSDNYLEAIKLFEKVLSIDKENPYTYFQLGNIIALKLNNPQKALEYFLRAVELNPDIEDGLVNLGNTYAMLNKPESAIESYNKYLYKFPNSVSTYINLGRVYESINNNQKAILSYKRALKINPNYELAKTLLNEIKE